MSTKSAFSIVGLAHKLCLVAESQGYTPKLLNDLAEHPELFDQLLKIQLGCIQIPLEITSNFINTDSEPFIPFHGLRVVRHGANLGILVWKPENICIRSVVSLQIRANEVITFGDLDEKTDVEDLLCLNMNVLKHLLEHPSQVPKDWKGKKILFLGTLYEGIHGLQAPYLNTEGGSEIFSMGFVSLNDKIEGNYFIAYRY